MKAKTIYIKNNRRTRKKVQQSVLRHLFHSSPLLSAALLVLVLLIAGSFFAYYFFHAQQAIKPKNKRIVPVQHSFTAAYMQDLLEKKYTDIWNLYTPSYQAFIQKAVGKNAYLTFLQQKFSDIDYGNISMTPCVSGQTTFPYGIERAYKNTCVTHLKMSLTTQNASVSSQLSTFENLPVVLIKKGKQYQIVGGGPTDLQAPVLYPPQPVTNKLHVPIVMYHLIQSIPLRSHYESDYAWRLDVGLTVTPQNFATQMDQLQQLGYHPISPNDLFNNLYYNLPLPTKAIVLTFDDGRVSDYTNGLPILSQYHFPAIFFIPPGLTGKVSGMDGHNSYMTYAQLKILTQEGMYVENHSLYHTAPLWNLKPNPLQLQLSEANADLENVTNYPIQFIAYDGSWPSRNWQQTTPAIEQTITVLSKMGFLLAMQDTGKIMVVENTQYPYQIPRIRGVNTAQISFITNAPVPTPNP